jgi:hypothetical protein
LVKKAKSSIVMHNNFYQQQLNPMGAGAMPSQGGPMGMGGSNVSAGLGANAMNAMSLVGNYVPNDLFPTTSVNVGSAGVQGPMMSGMTKQMLHAQQQAAMMDEERVYALILDLTNPAAREQALLELSKKREAYEDLAPILWHSFGECLSISGSR